VEVGSTMKAWRVVASALSLALSACGGGGDGQDESAPADGRHDFGDDVTVVVHGIADPVEPAGPAEQGISQPAPGTRWIAVDVEVVNDGGETVSVPLSVSELRTTDGRSVQPLYFGRGDMAEPGWEVPAGTTSRGWIGYEIPVDAEPQFMLAMRRQGALGEREQIDLQGAQRLGARPTPDRSAGD
jgi:hypothetical protein